LRHKEIRSDRYGRPNFAGRLEIIDAGDYGQRSKRTGLAPNRRVDTPAHAPSRRTASAVGETFDRMLGERGFALQGKASKGRTCSPPH
jgi:hypothetical protein